MKQDVLTPGSDQQTGLVTRFRSVRNHTLHLCKPLKTEDFVAQPVVDVSPPKWHLAHTTWFFENFVLRTFLTDYKEFHPQFNFLFNSYYESVGKRTIRHERGNLTRPTVDEVMAYREHINQNMERLFEAGIPEEAAPILEIGLHHEQQHQELLLTDLKYILGFNPLFPVYDANWKIPTDPQPETLWQPVAEGVHEIGYDGDGFCFDNELGRHKQYLAGGAVRSTLVTNREYLEFMADGGYTNFRHWLMEGWGWVTNNQIESPLYWFKIDGQWMRYGFAGLESIRPDEPVTHVSFYEAEAFAQWAGLRLPTEFEWEVASPNLPHGTVWEWTHSAYLPYPGYTKADGALGEYNGKFMVNQMVLRGGSVATPPDHARPTYRNFFHPYLQWQFTGIRLARD